MMKNQLNSFLEDLKTRVQKGKDNAFLFVDEERPVLVQGHCRFEVIEYSIHLIDGTGRKHSIAAFSPIESKPLSPTYWMLFDNHGSTANGEDNVRFLLFEGEKIVLSSNDDVTGFVYICAAQSNKRAVGISFSIATGPKGRYSGFVCDGDPNYIQYVRVAALLASSNEKWI